MSIWKQLIFPLLMAFCLILGPIVMTALLMGYHWVFYRSMLADGQYVFFLIVTVPSGGAAASSALAAMGKINQDRKLSELACFIGGFLTLSPALLYNAAVSENAATIGENPVFSFLGGLLALLPIFAAGLALIVAGLVIKRNTPRE